MAKKKKGRKKRGTRIPQENIDFADNYEYMEDLSEEKTHTLADGTKISPKEFLKKFNEEYYANDHNKEDSLHNIELGEKYSEEVVGQNRYGKDINMRKDMYQQANVRKQDVYSVLRGSKFHEDPNLLYDILAENGEEVIPAKKEDMKTINNLLKHYKYREIIDIFIDKAEDDCLNSDREYKDILMELSYSLILISLKIRKTRKEKF